jgi:hypothetical protein
MKNSVKLLILLTLSFTACSKTDLSGPDNALIENTEKELLTPDAVIAFKSGENVLGETDAVDLSKYPGSLWAVEAGDYVLSTGLYTQGRYQLYNTKSGETNYYLSYPNHPQWPNINEETKSILYASNALKVRPDNSAFVCADMYSGIMDICRIQNGEIKTIKQICFSYPKVYIKQEKDKAPEVAYSRDNRLGFSDISVTNDRIYALYSGQTYREDSNTIRESSNLLIFDWNGNLLRSFKIETPLTLLTFKEIEHAIYGTRFAKNYLIRYILP